MGSWGGKKGMLDMPSLLFYSPLRLGLQKRQQFVESPEFALANGARSDRCRSGPAFPLNKAAEVSGGSNVSNRAGRGVSVAFELIGERIDVWSTDSTAQAPQRLGRREKLL